ncbi:GntR family transcriptional regulator [Leucobacter aridicollis]|uniref:GntR family transcriptional regulator n=1 Tax=Leucobacter aridicollis TaxID=283878 RepID=UPI000E65D871|nr:GntR family transcriptional regulator [Leucobacter aridicollis]UTX52620.1 GntR family transcriptional regulator [Leucobacter aridicollis]
MQSPVAPGSLDRFADAPLWQQLSSALREEIDAGRLLPDQALPSESELINRYGVSRTVVREALADLVRAGLIYKVRARGSFVSPRRPELKFVGSMMGSSADLEATGRIITTKVIHFETDIADAKLAEELQIGVGDPVIRLRRLRFVDTAPWLLVDTVLPEQRFPNLARANLENQSLYDHLRRHYGVHPSGADRWISAVNPSGEDAKLLQLRPEDPILAIDSIAWDAQGVPFERYHALHRSDGNRFYLGIR